MAATIDMEAERAKAEKQEGLFAIFKGQNFVRFLIAAWPKITQQLVGLAVFNTYSTYFCTLAFVSPACEFWLTLQSSPSRRKPRPVPGHRHLDLLPDHLHDHDIGNNRQARPQTSHNLPICCHGRISPVFGHHWVL